jgi:hypothetical protein
MVKLDSEKENLVKIRFQVFSIYVFTQGNQTILQALPLC